MIAYCARCKVDELIGDEGALRETLARMSAAELIETYLRNERQAREHAAERRAENGASE